jgi:hypothetical protein
MVRALSRGYVAVRQESLATVGNLAKERKHWVKIQTLQDSILQQVGNHLKEKKSRS